MRNPTLWIGMTVVCLLTSGGALIHGRLVNRWGPPQAMLDAGNRLQEIPEQVGPWKLKSSQRLPESARSMLECTGDCTRTYVNPTTREMTTVTVLVGPVGPTASHSPEICLPAHDYRLLEKRSRVSITDPDGAQHELWVVGFQSQDLQAQKFHVYYGWSSGGSWSAPDNPRFELSGNPYLYKVQFVVQDGPELTNTEIPPFMAEFLSAARVALVKFDVAH